MKIKFVRTMIIVLIIFCACMSEDSTYNNNKINVEITNNQNEIIDLSDFKVNKNVKMKKTVLEKPKNQYYFISQAKLIDDNIFVNCVSSKSYEEQIIIKYNLEGKLISEIVVPSSSDFVFKDENIFMLCQSEGYILKIDKNLEIQKKIYVDSTYFDGWLLYPELDYSACNILFKNNKNEPCIINVKDCSIRKIDVSELKNMSISAMIPLRVSDTVAIYGSKNDSNYWCIYDYNEFKVSSFYEDFDDCTQPLKYLFDNRNGINYKLVNDDKYEITSCNMPYFASNRIFGNVEAKYINKFSLDLSGNIIIIGENLFLIDSPVTSNVSYLISKSEM